MHRKEGIYCTAGIFCSVGYVEKRKNVLYRRLMNILYSRIEEIYCTVEYVQKKRNILYSSICTKEKK